MASLVRIIRSSTEQGWKYNRVKVMQSRRERHDCKLKSGSLSENVGTNGCPRWRKCWSWG